MDSETLAAIQKAARQRRAAIKARDDASRVLADAARKVIAPVGPMSQRDFAELAGVDRTTVRTWLGKQAQNRPPRTQTPG